MPALFAGLLGQVSGAFSGGVNVLLFVLRESKKFLRVGLVFGSVYVVLSLTSSLVAFTSYHAVGLLVLLLSPFVTLWTIQLIVGAYGALALILFSKLAYDYLPS